MVGAALAGEAALDAAIGAAKKCWAAERRVQLLASVAKWVRVRRARLDSVIAARGMALRGALALAVAVSAPEEAMGGETRKLNRSRRRSNTRRRDDG